MTNILKNATPIIPIFPQDKPFEKDNNGDLNWTREYNLFWTQLLQCIQQVVSNEGVVIPTQDSDNVTIIQNSLLSNGEQAALPGTLLFNSSAVNGGTTDAPNGQLNVLLQDGVFHPITNS